MTDHADYRHWNWSIAEDHILHLTLDRADSSQNSLSREVLEELEQIVLRIEQERPQALILRSGKKCSFIVGADVSEFSGFTTVEEAAIYIRKVQHSFLRLEQLTLPTLAIIDGPCLGGGLELALACRYRIAVDDPTTSLGFPEIKLGIHPGFGGTVRSIQRSGALPALQLMLTGRNLSAGQAKRNGLVDASVPRRVLANAIRVFLQNPPRQQQPGLGQRLLNSMPLRPLLAGLLRRKIAAKVALQHYPAAGALLDLWREHGSDPEQMYQAEAESVARLLSGPTAQNLVRVFFLQMALKNRGKNAAPLRRVHVIGAGSMGRDIAAWCALQGLQVSLQDLDPQALGRAIAAADKLFRKKLRKKHLIRAAHDRLMPDPSGLGLQRAELVIEAIVEDAEVKKKLYQAIEPQLAADAILASNTSSIPLEELAASLARPERFLGIHFFNPVPKMPLVEVVTAAASAPEVIARAESFVQQIKHLPLPVKSAPGFLVNRVLMPYLLAAVKLVEEGYKPASIDQAALSFGMPMGPLHLADQVGLDICLSVAKVFAEHFKQPIPEILTRMVTAGQLGSKSGQGFYHYQRGQKKRSWKDWQKTPTDPQLTERLLNPLFAEAQACLAEGVVSSADLVDAGMIFGTGFAPFTGGPLHYLQQRQEAT